MPERQEALPPCRIRKVGPDDFDACRTIYRLNEPGRFPEGYLDHFCEWLTAGRSLVLVAERDRHVLGLGGIAIQPMNGFATAKCIMGMVHPLLHGHGLGTALLLARLALLPEPRGHWPVEITTTGGSETFYQRFGFRHFGYYVDERRTRFKQWRMRLFREDWCACGAALHESDIALNAEGIAVPVIPPGSTG
jgi:GNAT superfamily N-acetyltransferase